MKPKIIIVSEEGYAKNIAHFMLPCDYGTVVGMAGGLPLVALDATHPQSYADLGDGLLLTGGNFTADVMAKYIKPKTKYLHSAPIARCWNLNSAVFFYKQANLFWALVAACRC